MPKYCKECPLMDDDYWCRFIGEYCDMRASWAAQCRPSDCPLNNHSNDDKWIPCSEKPEYDFQNVLVRWHDKRKGCENDYYLFEGYVVRGVWCGMFEEIDMSDFEPIEWKPIESYKGEKNDECR